MLKIFSCGRLLNLIVAVTTLSTSLFLFQNAHAAAAGKVVFATGATKAVSNTGISRALRRGDEIFSGDKLQTARRSRLQISLTDGAYVSVQPDSVYQLENYQYSGKKDGSERAIFRLFKGGIRAVTGWIGKKNRNAYKVHTAVATIGIRGTGHNTRICAGDCPDKKDGLYHNTWEGITTVENNVDSRDVPAGKGVFVRDINSDIQSLDQPSGATAVETAKKEKEEQEEDEERSTLVSSSDQRSGDEGLQTIVVENQEVRDALDSPFGDPTFSEILADQVIVGVLPDSEAEESDNINVFRILDSRIFKNSDGNPIALIGTDDSHDHVVGHGRVDQTEIDSDEAIRRPADDDGMGPTLFQVFATIDPAAALSADDDVVVAEVQAFLDAADPELVDFFFEMPAEVAEFHVTEGISMVRWANGRILIMDKDLDTGLFDETFVDELIDFQSVHFIYGPTPPPLPGLGSATYNLIDATMSTTVSGATIGQGATDGFIAVDFGTATGFLNMDVTHNAIEYFVSGNFNNVFATTSAPGSACNPECVTGIDGSFFGPGIEVDSILFPEFLGLEYDISETDEIMGVAGFATTAGLIVVPPPHAQLTVVDMNVLHDSDPFVLTAPSGLPFQTLVGSTTTQTGFFGPGDADSPSICSSTCSVEIGATFAGDASSPIGNVPAEIGVVFKVFTGDPFSGAGGFDLVSTSD